MSTADEAPRAGRRRLRQALLAIFAAPMLGPVRKALRLFVADPGRATDEAVAIAGARSLFRSAGALKGGVAKVAQLSAYLGDPRAPPLAEAQVLLGQLFDQAPGADPAAIRRVVEEDLGRPLSALFSAWEEDPLGAASLGEVHGARGPGGEDLAVKVQYPDIAQALRADLSSTAVLRRLGGAALGAALSDEVLSALREAVLRESDYRIEAQALLRFRRAYRLDKDLIFPELYPDLSSARVLTQGRLRGRALLDFARAGDGAARAVVGQAIFRVAFGAPLVHGLLNADPNPGNFLVLPDGRTGFLDFGCCVEMDERTRTCEQVLWQALLAEDGEALRYALHREGLIRHASVYDGESYRAFERCLKLPFATHRFCATPAYARELALHMGALLRSGRFTMTQGAVLLFRQRLGLWAVLGELRAAADFRQLLYQMLQAVDMAPLGVR